MSQPAWNERSLPEVLAALETTESGLSTDEAKTRLAKNGPNALKTAPRVSVGKILLGQFKSLILWVLVAAGAVAAYLGESADAIAIFAIVGLNAAIGFYQEFRAATSIQSLQKMIVGKSHVLRAGQTVQIPTSEVVVGDVLVLAAGDLVAADARLLSAASLSCVEAALTGESDAADKTSHSLEGVEVPLAERENMVFLGTSVASGTGRAVVVATAMDTELGQIAEMIESAEETPSTPLQKKLDAFGRALVFATLGIVVLLFALGLWRGAKPVELFLTSVSLAVAAVPEGLPTVVTVALSLGVMRMAKRGALIRKLSAVETLGATAIICTDKTGTLTVGEMTARKLFVAGQTYEISGEGYGPAGEVTFEGKKLESPALSELAVALLACNDARLVEENGLWKTVGDPTEGALLTAGIKAGASVETIERELPREFEIPFDSDRKRSAVIRRTPDGDRCAFVKGAPGSVLSCCTQVLTCDGVRPLTETDRAEILAQTSAMGKEALRVLASASRHLPAPISLRPSPGSFPSPPSSAAEEGRSLSDGEMQGGEMDEREMPGNVEKELTFLGLTGMYDPPRPEAKGAIARCREAGIRVVMITGDHPDTAQVIARELGIDGAENALTGAQLDKLSAAEFAQRIQRIALFARVTAAHKLRIVRALKAGGAVVAMTGDGVNDAPALKGADIGIAMGRSGTEVTRQAADMIVTDDNFATIVAAVEEGRGIYANIRKTLEYLLAGNVGELLLVTVCVAANLPTPLLPIHLLWINLVTDGLPALCLAIDPIDPDLMSHKPRRRSEKLTDKGFLPTIFLSGVLTAGVALGAFLYARQTQTLQVAQTYAFSVLVVAELLRALGARSESKPVWRIPLRTNLPLIGVIVGSCALQLWSVRGGLLERVLKTATVPLSDCAWLFALGALPLAILEIVKAIRLSRAAGGAAPSPP